jgi:raffinose/stachyose/melibiose transport system permease protein
VPWVFAIPGVALLLIFHFAAPLSAVWYAFTDWNGISTPHWVGLGNFRQIFSQAATRDSLYHTLILAAGFMVGTLLLGSALALLLNRTLKSRHFLRALFFIPVVLTPLATSYVWAYIFTYDGALNRVLGMLGLESWQRPWTADPAWAIWTILLVMIWQYSGLVMVIFLAGLQSIPDELDEAAAVDGARTWYRLRKVTLPLLAPAITIAATITLVHGLRTFDQVMALTGGGPFWATQTLATQVYNQTFTYGKYGYGAALSVVLAVLVGVLVIGQLVVLRRREARI